MNALFDLLFCRNALNAPAAYFINACETYRPVIVLNKTGDIYNAIVPVNRPVKQAFIRPRVCDEANSCECLVAVNVPVSHAKKPVQICIGGRALPDSFLHSDPASGWFYFDFPIFIFDLPSVCIKHDSSPTVMIKAVMLPMEWVEWDAFVSSDNTFTVDFVNGLQFISDKISE